MLNVYLEPMLLHYFCSKYLYITILEILSKCKTWINYGIEEELCDAIERKFYENKDESNWY